jgi:hypothetical protein
MGASLDECLRAHELRNRLYSTWHGGAGGCLHVVLDDGNVNNETAANILKWAQEYSSQEVGHEFCVPLAEIVVKMSPTQRLKLGAGGYEGAWQANRKA